MATERKSPDAIISYTGFTGLLSAITDDPDSADGNWLLTNASGGTLRVSFPTPTGDPTTGSNVQEFRVLLRKDAAAGGTPSYSAELRETGGGTALQTLASNVDVTTTDPGTVVSLTWDAANLGTADGSAVELLITTTKGGGGGNERNVEIGAVEWNVDYSTGPTPLDGTGAVTLGGLTVSGAGDVPRTGSGGATLGGLTVSGAGDVPRTGSGGATLGGLTVSGAGSAQSPIEGSGGATLGGLTVSSAGHTSLFISDSFDDTAGTAFTSHSPEIGGAWSKMNSTNWPGDAAIQTSGLSNSYLGNLDDGNDQAKYVNARTPPSADQSVKVLWEVGSSLSAAQFENQLFLYARVVDQGTTTYEFCQLYLNVTDGTGSLQLGLNETINGSGNPRGTQWTPSNYIAADTVYEVELRVYGTAIEAWFDGVKRIESTLTTVTGTGKAGIGLSNIQLARNGDANPTSFTATRIDVRSGTGDVTLGGLTVAAAGDVPRTGTGTPALGGLTVSGAGEVQVQGAGGATLGALTVASAGEVLVQGAGSALLGGLTVASAGEVPVQGTGSALLGALEIGSAGLVPRTGTGSVTLGALTAAGAGSGVPATEGTGAVLLGALTASGAGEVLIQGTGSALLGGLTITSAGDVPMGGVGVPLLGAVQAAGIGAVLMEGAGALTMGALTVTAEGGLADQPVAGSGGALLAGLTASGAGEVLMAGSGALSLGGLTASGAGGVAVQGSGGVTLGGLSTAGVGDVPRTGSGGALLGGIQTYGYDEVNIVGGVAVRGIATGIAIQI